MRRHQTLKNEMRDPLDIRKRLIKRRCARTPPGYSQVRFSQVPGPSGKR